MCASRVKRAGDVVGHPSRSAVIPQVREHRIGHVAGSGHAIKVLPALLAADPEALVRFEREMKILAARSHPHIVAAGQGGGSPRRNDLNTNAR